MLLVITVQARVSKRFAAVRARTARCTDARARASAEAFAAMLSLKAYGWERDTAQRVGQLREAEARSIFSACMAISSIVAPPTRVYGHIFDRSHCVGIF